MYLTVVVFYAILKFCVPLFLLYVLVIWQLLLYVMSVANLISSYMLILVTKPEYSVFRLRSMH